MAIPPRNHWVVIRPNGDTQQVNKTHQKRGKTSSQRAKKAAIRPNHPDHTAAVRSHYLDHMMTVRLHHSSYMVVFQPYYGTSVIWWYFNHIMVPQLYGGISIILW
ncbi:hypothetical protein RhiirA1_452373 [Rhizophagus irregularis]|uniref:Uncharacterized protein n=1 Tax=Rhizophagus irregularis TaxID=588596 RepID=A0A2I1F6H8_9GLOM|nr:hypothetical protein RhiirA1_452373 [Rhizophagus irregularis]PKY29975.1 hypothetical protein RhiirB3_446834 [Rhizophagus irregularis]